MQEVLPYTKRDDHMNPPRKPPIVIPYHAGSKGPPAATIHGEVVSCCYDAFSSAFCRSSSTGSRCTARSQHRRRFCVTCSAATRFTPVLRQSRTCWNMSSILTGPRRRLRKRYATCRRHHSRHWRRRSGINARVMELIGHENERDGGLHALGGA